MPEPEPEHAATAQQALRILSLSIAGMPDRRRLAFERFVFADRTAGQVATEMGVSVKMIEKHVAQARAYCRQMLDAGACSLTEACSQRCGSRSGQEMPACVDMRPVRCHPRMKSATALGVGQHVQTPACVPERGR